MEREREREERRGKSKEGGGVKRGEERVAQFSCLSLLEDRRTDKLHKRVTRETSFRSV